MRIIVDTSAWSVVLRRKQASQQQNTPLRLELESLISVRAVAMLGVIRQELLSGIRHVQDYERLKHHLRNFDDEPISSEDHESAAELSNLYTSQGLANSPIDMLICAVALRTGMPVLTLDNAFRQYAAVSEFSLYTVGK